LKNLKKLTKIQELYYCQQKHIEIIQIFFEENDILMISRESAGVPDEIYQAVDDKVLKVNKDNNNNYQLNQGQIDKIIQEAGQGKTTITGAVIVAGSYQTITNEDGTQTMQFVDNGNLQLNTKELAYNNVNDFYNSKSKGFGTSTDGGTTSDSGKSTLAPSGSTTVSAKSTGEERE
jgi:ABC-type branched-subunit amino acid transport system ATPase component